MQEIKYREAKEISKAYKTAYLNGIKEIIQRREVASISRRNEYCKEIFQNQEKYRADFKVMLGWPLTEERSGMVPKSEIDRLSVNDNCIVYRISIEVMEGLSMTGLLFQKDEEKRPLVIAQHGGMGTPEQIGNLYGDTANYNHIVERILAFGVNVFAPQLLMWNPSYNVGFSRRDMDACLNE